MDNFYRYEYELSHSRSDPNLNKVTNNRASSQFTQLIVDSILDYTSNKQIGLRATIVLLFHSTAQGVSEYIDLGV